MASSRHPKSTSCFIDASVLFAASHSHRGSARDLIVAGLRGQVTLVLSPFVIDEARHNLVRKAPGTLRMFEAFLDPILTVAPSVALVEEVATVIALKDAPVVAGAIHAGAMFLATYDRKHLLSRREEIFAAFGVTVATPSEILASL
jgi:predicted nucleic acid-binding protein